MTFWQRLRCALFKHQCAEVGHDREFRILQCQRCGEYLAVPTYERLLREIDPQGQEMLARAFQTKALQHLLGGGIDGTND